MRPYRGLLVSAVVAATALLATGASPSLAAPPDSRELTYQAKHVDAPNPQDTSRWAERLQTLKDLDGNGANEILVGVPSENLTAEGGPCEATAPGCLENAGHVYLLEGKTRRVLYSVTSPEPQARAQFGFFIQVPGDLDGDGTDDFAVGTSAQDTTASGASCAAGTDGCNVDQGKAWVFSGADGDLLYELNSPVPQAGGRFGERIGTAGDISGDGVPELIVGAPTHDSPPGCENVEPLPDDCQVDQGQAFIFDGRTAELLRTLDVPPEDRATTPCSEDCGIFGKAVQGPGDTDGDGVTDQLVDAPAYGAGPAGPMGGRIGRMYLFSGATGELLHKIDNPTQEPGSGFGFQDAMPGAPGDVNGDGFADIYGNGFAVSNPAHGEDGLAEGMAWVFNGKTGEILYRLEDPTPSKGGQFGWSVATTDHDGDGRPDLYVGSSPHHFPGTDQNGGTYVFEGSTGALMEILEIPEKDRQPVGGFNRSTYPLSLGPNLGWGLTAPGDLNGDGQPDYVAGAPFFAVGDNVDQGRLYVFRSKFHGPPAVPPGQAGDRPGPR
ncbi:MAG TPA: hypothetical protein VNT56_08475 [Acidimicrobiales bacterium]|nr:hypothetical protein [Acidimicrobiales bacterium]